MWLEQELEPAALLGRRVLRPAALLGLGVLPELWVPQVLRVRLRL
ncbi:hypothetical protein GCM10027038_06200 [Arthrobacter bambusae]